MTLMEWEVMHRKHAKTIEEYLKTKGYIRDVPNNSFIKKTGSDFYDFNEIRYVKNYICIWNTFKNTKHKKKIFDILE